MKCYWLAFCLYPCIKANIWLHILEKLFLVYITIYNLQILHIKMQLSTSNMV